MPACRLRVKAYSLLVARSIVGTGFTVASVVAPTPFGGDWLVDTATVVCGAIADPSAFAGGLDACLALALADGQAAAKLQDDGLQSTNGLEAAAATATKTQLQPSEGQIFAQLGVATDQGRSLAALAAAVGAARGPAHGNAALIRIKYPVDTVLAS